MTRTTPPSPGLAGAEHAPSADRAAVTQLRTPRIPRQAGPAPATQGSLALDTAPEVDRHDTEIRAWAAQFAQAAVEVAGGERPAIQLLRWTGEQVYADLERRAALVIRARGQASRRIRPQVRSVHACSPTPDSAEVSVHVRHGERSRALALRMERRRGRWQCVVLQFV
jgi:hypothetical protein